MFIPGCIVVGTLRWFASLSPRSCASWDSSSAIQSRVWSAVCSGSAGVVKAGIASELGGRGRLLAVFWELRHRMTWLIMLFSCEWSRSLMSSSMMPLFGSGGVCGVVQGALGRAGISDSSVSGLPVSYVGRGSAELCWDELLYSLTCMSLLSISEVGSSSLGESGVAFVAFWL